MTMVDWFEKIPLKIFADLKEGSVYVANLIATLIREKQKNNEPCILGLATGNSPKAVYTELVRLHKYEALSFKNVITFNLDEYYPIDKDAFQSYNRFMKAQLFDHVDIDPANTHVPDGEIKKDDIKAYANAY